MFKTTIKLGQEEVVLDPAKLTFNEATLGKYLEEEAAWYDYFGTKLAEAEYLLQSCELRYEQLYAEKFCENKELGGSDKLAEAKARGDVVCIAAKQAAIEAKRNVKHLQQHIRSWDKNHDNAQNRGNTLRKEIDKLFNPIKMVNHDDENSNLGKLSDKIDDIINNSADDDVRYGYGRND